MLSRLNYCAKCQTFLSLGKRLHGLPKIRRFANDRAPTLEEIRKIVEYPDRRIKAVVFTMASSGIRLGAWEYLRWGHVKPIEREGKIVAAKMFVYSGDDEEYFAFITPEAYFELKKWMTVQIEYAYLSHWECKLTYANWDRLQSIPCGFEHLLN